MRAAVALLVFVAGCGEPPPPPKPQTPKHDASAFERRAKKILDEGVKHHEIEDHQAWLKESDWARTTSGDLYGKVEERLQTEAARMARVQAMAQKSRHEIVEPVGHPIPFDVEAFDKLMEQNRYPDAWAYAETALTHAETEKEKLDIGAATARVLPAAREHLQAIIRKCREIRTTEGIDAALDAYMRNVERSFRNVFAGFEVLDGWDKIRQPE